MTAALHPFEATIADASVRGNALLGALPPEAAAGLTSHLEWLWLAKGTPLCVPASPVAHAYFPTTAIASLLYVTRGGATGEIAIVGNDGGVGIAMLAGQRGASHGAVVQFAGYAYRIRRDVLAREFERGGALHDVLLRYLQALLVQITQNAICNRHHRLDQHLCRWLLLVLDRLSTQSVPVTQETIASLLGVRRESVSEAASRLKARGLVDYRRGRIDVLDRRGLEDAACECYDVMRDSSERLSGHAQAPPRRHVEHARHGCAPLSAWAT